MALVFALTLATLSIALFLKTGREPAPLTGSWVEVDVSDLPGSGDKYLGQTVVVKGFATYFTTEMKSVGGSSSRADFYILSDQGPGTGTGIFLMILQSPEKEIFKLPRGQIEVLGKWVNTEVEGTRRPGLLYLTHTPD